MLNDRPLWLIARNVGRPVNYVALARMRRVYERPLDAAGRYFLGRGTYPCTVRVRTPLGTQSVRLFHSHDAITLHEIFCREDYSTPTPPKVVVDVGSNIGISALYFLTRSPATVCELYEPDPRNIAKLKENLAGFENRFTLHEYAVADRVGTFPFTREATGRYGGLDVALPASSTMDGPATGSDAAPHRIDVRVEHVNSVIDRAAEVHGTVDVLKIDTEGSELATVKAIGPDQTARVRRILIEWFDRAVALEGFDVSSSGDTVTFVNRRFE